MELGNEMSIVNGGEMGANIRAFDWISTIQPIEDWSVSLRTSVNIVLQSPVPMVLLWGEDGIMIYNDPYARFAGERHPSLLGSKVLEGWAEVAEFNKNVLTKCLAGQTLSYRDQTLTLYRNNRPEEVSMDLNYSPVIDEHGKAAGVLAIVVETTDRVAAERSQRKAEEALRLEQGRLQNLFKNAPSFITVLKGPNHVFELANDLYMQLIGRDRSVVGKTVSEALPEVVKQGFIAILDKVYADGEPFISSETQVMLDRNGDGQLNEVYVNFIYQPIKNEEGITDGIFVQGIDVTDMVKARRLADDQNNILEMITGGASLSETLDNLIYSIEKHSAKGMKASILLMDQEGRHLLHGAGPSLPDEYNNAIHGIAIGEKVGSCGTAAYKGEPVVVADIATDPLWSDFRDLAKAHGLRSCWSTPIISARNNKILGTFALYYDEPHEPTEDDLKIIDFATRTAALVIDRKKTEEDLTEREEYFRVIADNMQNLAWMMNPDGNRTWYNKQWYHYTGLREKESLGFGWKKLHHPEHAEKILAAFEKGWSKGEVFELTFPLRGKGNKYRRFLTRVFPIKDTEGKILRWIGTNTDVEEQETITETLEMLVAKRTAELLQSNTDLQQFAHVASHDLKEPVRKIKTFANILRSQYEHHLPEEGRLYLEKVQKSAERVKVMIDGVLQYSSINSYETRFETINLNDEIQSVLSDLEILISEKKAEIEITELPEVEGIRVLLHQLFLNLINNALKFSVDSPQIIITWEKVRKKSLLYAEITVKDNGIGFEEEYQEKIFDAFARLHSKDKFEGSGLGLSLCKRIVDRHNGFIYAEGRKNEGATFTILLPFLQSY